MSTRPSGRLISTTSAHDPSPSAPISTNLKTQATYPPSVRERARKYPTAVAPPISRRSPPMSDTIDQLPTEIAPTGRLLTAAEFYRLADVPPEVEWFANLSNPYTRRVYENAVKDFMRFKVPAKIAAPLAVV